MGETPRNDATPLTSCSVDVRVARHRRFRDLPETSNLGPVLQYMGRVMPSAPPHG